jgi:signal transduction histidine kinase
MNLTHKFIASILFMTFLAVSVFTYLQISEQKEILKNELNQRVLLIRSNLDANAQHLIHSLKYEVENDIATFNFSHIDASFQHLVEKEEIDAVVLFNRDKSKQLFAIKRHLEPQQSTGKHDTFAIEEIKSENNFIVSLPIDLSENWGELHVAYSLKALKEEVLKAEKNIKEKIDLSVKKAVYSSVFLAFFLVLFSYFFAQKIISPILLLTETAKEIAGGKLEVSDRLKTIASNDEIGLLFSSFIDMSQKLDTSYKELHILNKNLKQKTEELQELNESLEIKVAQKVAQITEQERMMISQSRLAAMGEMMSMIAHQWRQPLATTTLMITNERIASMIARNEPNESDKILDKISDTMIYLSDMIDDFQTFFKPDKSTEKISTCALIERVQHFIQTRLILEKVHIHIEKCDEIFIDTYANEVVQVLINIVNNAVDALVERKREERYIWISVHSGKNDAIISIEDNGGGIESEIIEKVFDPYFSTKSKNGTGLGLYMAKMIIDKHVGGKLSVDNTQKGACFTIILPKKSLPETQKS